MSSVIQEKKTPPRSEIKRVCFINNLNPFNFPCLFIGFQDFQVSGIPDKNKLYTPSKLIELDEEKKREKEQLQAEKLLKKQEAERKKKEKADARETKKKEKEMKLNQQENEKKSKEQSKILKEQQKALKNLDLHDIYDQENRPPRPVNIVVTRQKASSINYSKLNDSGF